MSKIEDNQNKAIGEVENGIEGAAAEEIDNPDERPGCSRIKTRDEIVRLCSAGHILCFPSTSVEQIDIGTSSDGEENLISPSPADCPICLQACIHPARLPCGHIFCFLCVKGVAYKNRSCAMCRREIPPEFLEYPQLVNGIEDICRTKTTEDGYQWFYEGRNGWWQYDDRTSQDIEEAYKKEEKSCTILVAGYVYVVDFEAMLQQRQNEPTRRRRVKRDLASIPKKGVAGLRIEGNSDTMEAYFAAQPYHGRHVSLNSSDDVSPSSQVSSSASFLSNESSGVGLPVMDRQIRSNNTDDLITTIATTDAAIRIANDIIDSSTLAQANERSGDYGVVGSRNLETRSNNRRDHFLTSSALSMSMAFGVSEDLLEATDGSISEADLFEQNLSGFHSLSLRDFNNSAVHNDDSEEITL